MKHGADGWMDGWMDVRDWVMVGNDEVMRGTDFSSDNK